LKNFGPLNFPHTSAKPLCCYAFARSSTTYTVYTYIQGWKERYIYTVYIYIIATCQAYVVGLNRTIYIHGVHTVYTYIQGWTEPYIYMVYIYIIATCQAYVVGLNRTIYIHGVHTVYTYIQGWTEPYIIIYMVLSNPVYTMSTPYKYGVHMVFLAGK
jgi:hypothetical protein